MKCFAEDDFNTSILLLLNEGGVELPIALDDSEVETSEGYILFLDVDINSLHPLDARRIQFLNRYILVTIEDDDSMLLVGVHGDHYSIIPLTCHPIF